MNPNVCVGTVSLPEGDIGANSMGLNAEFFGTSAHAHSQHKAVDAIRMAVEAYLAMELICAREIPSTAPCVMNIGAFNAGHTNNIICDYAKLQISARTHSDELTEFLERRIREVCEGVANMAGGRAEVSVTKLLPYVINNPVVTRQMRKAAAKVVGEENLILNPQRGMGGEDFSFLCRRKPGAMFRMSVRDPESTAPIYPVHNDHFDVDERCFDVGIPIFVNFVLDNQDGIEF